MEEKTELTVPERAAVALGAAEHEKALIELSKKYADIVEIKNKAGREQAHAAYMTLKNARVAIETAGKDARDDANKFSKAVIAEVDRLTAITIGEEDRLLDLRNEWDAAAEAERQAKLAAEKARIATIRAKIDAIRSTPAKWLNKPSSEIGAAADHLSETVVSLDEYQEFCGECQVERDHAVRQMREMQASMVLHEAEQARLAAEREALAKERAEAAERERVAAATRAEEDRKAREALETEKRRQIAERVAAEERLRAEREVEEKRLAAERAVFAKQQAELAEQQRQLREATERLAREQREREEAEARAKQEAIEAAQRAEAEKAMEALRAQEEAAAKAQRESEERAATEEAERLAALPVAPVLEIVEMVSISKKEYDWLLTRSAWLDCLEAAGVDNWSGFDDARDILREQAA